MANKNPPAVLLLYQLVRVETTLIDPTSSTEDKDAFYSFVGVLLDVDDKYITLGYEKEGELIANTAMRHEDIRLIQVYTGESPTKPDSYNSDSVN